MLAKIFSWPITIIGWFFKGPLSRVLDTVDSKIENETERQAIRLKAIEAFAQAQVAMMNGPGRWLLYIFAVPLGAYYASVIGYSMLLCRGCAYPQTWTIAALPPPLDQWSWAIVCSFFGYGAALAGVGMFKSKGN